MPKLHYSYTWFMDAYSILSNSANESGTLPLSELKTYKDNFGLICSFSEFAHIIYAINNAYIKHRIVNIKNK